MKLSETVKELSTRKQSGTIEDHFSFRGREYVRVREDTSSNYLPITNNTLREIRDPNVRLLVELVADLLYR